MRPDISADHMFYSTSIWTQFGSLSGSLFVSLPGALRCQLSSKSGFEFGSWSLDSWVKFPSGFLAKRVLIVLQKSPTEESPQGIQRTIPVFRISPLGSDQIWVQLWLSFGSFFRVLSWVPPGAFR